MRKILFTLAIIAFFACPAMAQRYRGFQLFIVDEFGDAVTNIDTVEIYDAGTSTTSTIYSTRAGVARTNPMTTTSGGFTQSLGLVEWYQRAASFKVTVTESGASQSLTVDNLTSTDTQFAWFVNYIGEAATLQVTDTTTLDIGTSDDFTHDWDNSNSRYVIASAADGGRLDFGYAAVHTDVYFHAGDITTDYTFFDEGSLQMSFVDIDLLIDDEAKLLIGDSGDVTIEYDESNNDLDITSTTALDLITFGADTDGYDLEWFGTTTATYALFDYSADELLLGLADLKISQGSQIEFIDVSDGLTDWTIDNATDETLLIYPTEITDDQTVNLGNATNTTDLRLFGATASTVVFDASADAVLFDVYNIALGDGDSLLFGDTLGTGDFSIVDTSDVLVIDVVAAGVGEIAIGNDADDVPLTWYAETASSFFKLTADDVQLDAMSLCLGDSDQLQFGDVLGTGDIKVYATGTDLIIDGVVAEVGTVAIGVTDKGLDFKLWAATNAEGVLWDASDEALEFTGANLTLDAASVLTLGQTVNADTVVTTGTYAVLAANSGKVHVIPDLAGDTAINLPAEADGLYYKFIYCGAAAEAHDHTIDSENNTNFFIGGVAFIDSDAGAGADELSVVFCDGNSNSEIVCVNLENGSVIELHCDGTNWYLTGTIYSDTTPTVADN